jgi:hypothetical protein
MLVVVTGVSLLVQIYSLPVEQEATLPLAFGVAVILASGDAA